MERNKLSRVIEKVIVMVVMLAILFVNIPVINVSANSNDNQTSDDKVIRIGYIDYEGFFDKGDDGTFSGYGVELLDAIASYTGWKYEFVFDTFANHLENLKTGKIDFICHAQKNVEREETYSFSKYPTGSESSVLYARQDDERFYYDDYKNLNGVTVGFLKGSYQNDEFAQFAAIHGFTYEAKFFDTQSDTFNALNSGQVDAVAMGSLVGASGYKVVSLFGSDPFYFMTGKDNQDMLDELDQALGQIFASNPTYTASLFDKYYSFKSASNGMLFTRDEAEYIKKCGTITVGLMANRSPLSYENEQGKPDGMLVELMNKISKKSGLQFQFKFLEPDQTGKDFLTNADGDLVAGVASSVFSRPNTALLQSDSLLNASVVFVGRAGMQFSPDASLTVALPSGFINGKQEVSAVYPNFKFIACDTNEECLDAIQRGKADIMLQNLYVIRECLQSPRYNNLQIFPAYEYSENEKVVSLPDNKVLISIVNKTISSFTQDDMDHVVVNHTVGKTYHTSIGEVLFKYRFPLIGIVILLLTVFVLIMLMMINRQRNYRAMKQVNGRLEMSNLQLEDAVKQADRASIAKSQFLARMSHEIRTPMNAIVGLTTIARSHLGDKEKMDDYLRKIDTSSRVLLNIINDVLDMSAIESEKLRIDESDFDLKQVLSGISTIYYSQCKNKGIEFNLGVDLTQELLIGDSLRVNQVLLNLVSNAFKFTMPGGRITVSVRETEHRNQMVYIRFKVSDTGCGMSEEMMSRLFHPFEQESSKTAKEHGGGGLGLSIAKNLVELMHGAISVESEKNKGTTFTVDIPFEISDKNLETKKNAIRNLRALIVDDDIEVQEYTGIILERIGIPYTVVSNGEDALSELDKSYSDGDKYDVCFVDWKMPGMDGVELTKKIRKFFDHDTLVIIVSAYDVSEIEDEAKTAGADVFVTKPLFQSTVFNVLMQLSGGKYTNETCDPKDYDFTGHKVLLAEDNELNSEIAIELLNMVHMDVERAENGQEAYELFTSSNPGYYDLILMDVQMPVMDGYEATKAIRNSEHTEAKTIPIIAMTANAFSSDVSAALSAGMNGHLAKPIDTKLMYQLLDKYSSTKGGRYE